MEVINGDQGNPTCEREAESGVLAETTKSVLADYLSVVSTAAEAAINEQATDPVEEAARALAAGFGAAMIHHGELLYGEGYHHGDLGLPGDSRTGHEAERPPLK
jgi:hypothetical protein